jgi:hypothetical protein
MTIVVPKPPLKSDTCRVETAIDYQRVQIGGSPLLLPELTLLKLWEPDGMRYENRTEYAACRAFQSESVFRPESEPSVGDSSTPAPAPASSSAASRARMPIPPGITLQIAVRSNIDEASSFAGDAIEGQLQQAIRARDGAILASQGAIVHGRIVRFEEHSKPSHYFALGLRFQSLALDEGEVPLTLEVVPRSREEQILNGPLEGRHGVGMFMFSSDRLVVDHRFVSEWKTATRRPSEE